MKDKGKISDKIVHILNTVNLWHFVWISIVLSEIFTAIMSVILRGRITYDYLITGGVVSLAVASIIIYFIYQLRGIEKSLLESQKKYSTLVEKEMMELLLFKIMF